MNLALWAVQALLALAFLAAGSMKLAVPVDQLLANGMSFVAYTPEALVRFIGACEVAGALGLVLPSALRDAYGTRSPLGAFAYLRVSPAMAHADILPGGHHDAESP